MRVAGWMRAFSGSPLFAAVMQSSELPRRTPFLAAGSRVAAVSCSPTKDMFSISDRNRITKRGFVVASVHGRAGISGDSKRVPAPAKIRPAARVDLAVLDRFMAGNKSCGQLMVRTRGKDVKRIRFWDPSSCPGSLLRGRDWTRDHCQQRTLSATAGRTSSGLGELPALVKLMITDIPVYASDS